MPLNTQPSQHEIFTVSQLNLEARILLEDSFQQVWIIGEISNLSKPSSGHLYFSLKDSLAQIRCALFRMRNKLNFSPENGQQVLLQAQVSLYEARGDFQLIVTHMELAGSGALQLAFEKLKDKLNAEGLFDDDHKKSIPIFPQKIGVITSASGAAIQDILTVLQRRFASIPVVIYPCMVQGEKAASQIVSAIQIANRRHECDVLILARGGGSLEDLWPFNEEIVARAIYQSHIPLVTGIGHEVDFTIADFVADLRAPTPSAAAESITPDKIEWQKNLLKMNALILKCMQVHLRQNQSLVGHLNKRLRHPGQRLRDQMQRLDQLEQSLSLAQQNLLLQKKSLLNKSISKLESHSPKQKLSLLKNKLQMSEQQLIISMKHKTTNLKQQIKNIAYTLEAINPLKVLQRGYAIVKNKKTQKIIASAAETQVGDDLSIQLAAGSLECQVTKQIKNPALPS